MFRRYPYWGWLLISILLWGINVLHFHAHRQEMMPERMADAVAYDLHSKESALDDILKDGNLVGRIFKDSLSEEDSKYLNDLPFYFYAYDSTFLVYWNTNAIIPGKNDTAFRQWAVQRNEKGVFIEKSINLPSNGNRRFVVLFPVLVTYPIENEYLKSHFVASEYIPVRTKIVTGGGIADGAYPVIMKDGRAAFSLRFDPTDIQKWVPDTSFIVMLIAALLATISWIHLMVIHLTRNKSNIAGLVLTLVIIAILRIALYLFGLPFNLDTLKFFDPRLYASSKYLSSFGDLCINTLCFLWIIVFVTRHTSYKTYFTTLSRKLRYPVVVLLAVALCVYVFLFVNVVRSLVLDSNISFDVSHFYAINVYTVMGLLVISTITGMSCVVIYIFNLQFNALIKNRFVKYLLIAIAGTLFLFFSKYAVDVFWWYLLVWLLVFFAILDIRNFGLVSDLFEPHMVFWAAFICVFCTTILQYFNNIKEHKARIAYVELNLSPQRDNIMEFAFSDVAAKIERDSTIRDFFYNPTPAGRRAVNKLFDTSYLTGTLKKYQVSVYLYDDLNFGLFNRDTFDFSDWTEEIAESAPTASDYLFYKESILDNHYYVGTIPVYAENDKQIGTVIFDLDLKQQEQETVYPELLQPSDKLLAEDNEYEHAIYAGGKLITQTYDYSFPTRLPEDTLKVHSYAFYRVNGVSELHYKDTEKRTIVVVHHHNEWLESATLFSYIFVIQVVIALVILLYQLYLSYFAGAKTTGRFRQLTLRRRVHFSMLAIVFISFVLIGFVTIYFFYDNYGTKNESALRSKMQVARESIQEYLDEKNAYASSFLFDSVSSSPNFKYFVVNLAASHGIDINVFDENGNLFSTSQEDIYEKGLLSRMIKPDAYYLLNTAGRSKVVQDEKVGDLHYLSAYEPLRNEDGMTLGYLNVPFFASEKDLDHQISSILVTLINLYAVVFLLSSLLTVGITRWITRSFNIIIEQFARLNLQRNERISWPYEDEIGLLVQEYNKMVDKVEENAALLAQSERETAWREMARQVAHEIKNPLTPMKLNIQYLQQAVRNNNPNIGELTARVSASIIEQIDNLSYIASEFSNFAKMPEAKPEELELSSLVHKAAELYVNDPEIKLSINEAPREMHVWSDKSQLLRVCNNLLENAKHATLGKEHPAISISLSSTDGSAIIAIKDNGVGISEEVAQRIFQPYFTTKSSGTGLGLAMTKKIVEFWKGEIWFDTEEGKGTTFFIKLPLMSYESGTAE